MVEITEIDRDEALRYLCCHDENNIGETAGKYLDECESRLLGVISPKFLYRYFPLSFKDGVPVISGCTLALNGSNIAAHFEGCHRGRRCGQAYTPASGGGHGKGCHCRRICGGCR